MPPRIFKQIEKSPIWNWFKNCAVCGAVYPPIKILCSYCTQRLKNLYIKPQYMIRLQSSFFHVRLIDWTSKNQLFIRLLLKNLKGTNDSLLFEILAQEFCFRIRQLESIQRLFPYQIIPCPAAPQDRSLWDILLQKKTSPLNDIKDHSFYWAQALSQKIKYPVENILAHPPYYSLQKHKDLYNRQGRKFILNNKVSPHQNYIFTDDIVTSGATAKAAYRALGKPSSFMVWSIFWKKKDFSS